MQRLFKVKYTGLVLHQQLFSYLTQKFLLDHKALHAALALFSWPVDNRQLAGLTCLGLHRSTTALSAPSLGAVNHHF